MDGLNTQAREQDGMKRLACQKTTPARSERIGESFVTWIAFEKSAANKRKCQMYAPLRMRDLTKLKNSMFIKQ